jgi:ferredoxin
MTINTPNNSVANNLNGSITEKPVISGLVLVCANSPVSSVLAKMAVDNEAWCIQVIDDLCRKPDRINEVVSSDQINRLVVALCQGEYSKTEVLSRSRRAGVETFGTQIIEIPSDGQGHINKAVAITGIRGAIARSEAFPGAEPENIKTSFADSGEKISRRALFTIPPIEYRSVPTIDRSVCIAGSGCTQCEKECPHDAIKNVGGTVNIDVGACNSCGICVAACPQRAVEFPSHSPSEIEQQVEAVLSSENGAGTNIAFACAKSANLPIDNWQIVPVACAGMVPAAALLSSLSSGARSVGILRCVEECAQQSKNTIDGRIDYAKHVLERTGFDPARIVDFAPADSQATPGIPEVTEPTSTKNVAINIFGHTAASTSVLALNELSPTTIEPFSHPYSPIGVPVVNSAGCTMCGTCSAVCPAGALSQINSEGWIELTLDAAKCIACGECVASCPEIANEAIELSLQTDIAALTVGPVILNSDQSVSCTKCNLPFTSNRTLQRLEDLLGDDFSHDLYGALCPECRALS